MFGSYSGDSEDARRFRYNIEQNQSHGLHKICFVVQGTVTYAINIRRMSKKYTELDRSVLNMCAHM